MASAANADSTAVQQSARCAKTVGIFGRITDGLLAAPHPEVEHQSATAAFHFGLDWRIKMMGRSEDENLCASRKAPAAGSTSNIQRSTPNFQSKRHFVFGVCPWELGVGS